MEVRRRMKKNHNGKYSSNEFSSRPTKMTSFIYRKPFFILTLLGMLFLGYLAIADHVNLAEISSGAIDSIAGSLNLHKPLHVVIIDAGSTGSRLLAFQFHTSKFDQRTILDNEYFFEIKPGLSTFADEPKEGIKTIAKLVENAKAIIPPTAWAFTPISMKATAGLRLLHPAKANAIIEECRKYLTSSGFLVTKSMVSIMEASDEGIFAWFTVNYLIGKLSSNTADHTVAVLDLGGGSTQITYAPNKKEWGKLDKHIHKINAFNHNMSIYTHSLLGMGLMAARKAILTADMDLESLNASKMIEIHSECINPIISESWSYSGMDFLVKGPVNGSHKLVKTRNYAKTDHDQPVVRFGECVRIIKKIADSKMKNHTIGINKFDIYLVSYYFDRASEAGLIDPFKGGVIKVGDFHKAAMDTCNYPNTDQPFMCLDLTFIYVLLHHCFGLETSTKLHLYKKYDGHELSWALGSAFSVLQSEF